MRPRIIFFLLFNIAALALYFPQLLRLCEVSMENELYSHVFLIPLVSGYIIHSNRKDILSQTGYGVKEGLPVITASGLLYIAAHFLYGDGKGSPPLSLSVFSAVLAFTGGFVFFLGKEASRKALFPLFFLLFMVPAPGAVMDRVILLLQRGSAEVTSVLYTLAGLEYERRGFVFNFTGLSIEVARECSGIRSSLSLLIIGVLAGHIYLGTAWRRWALLATVLPLTVLKNGLRILALTLAGLYIDERALSGPLHSRGGIPFFLMALCVLGVIAWALRRNERRGAGP